MSRVGTTRGKSPKVVSQPGKLKANTLGLWDVVFMAVATFAAKAG